jgi:glycosyltransferase involved in cell wall biosynthesis
VKIAVIGPLEFPGRQGGMTRHIEEVYARLADEGHDVTIFCRRAPAGREYRGMRIRTVPAIPASPWDRLTYSATASAIAATSGFDVVHYHSYANSTASFLPRSTGTKVLMTVHRLEWLDEKWGRVGRAILQASAWITHRVANAFIVVSRDFEEYVRRHVHRARPVVRIPNGVTLPEEIDDGAAARLGLRPGHFLLAVSRLVPEKGLDVLFDALDDLGDVADQPKWPLVVAGQARHPTSYSRGLEARVAGSDRVRLLGVQPASTVHGLYRAARALVAPSRREGNPLTIIEAMAHGTCIVATDIPPHQELLGDAALLVPVDDHRALADAIAKVTSDAAYARALGDAARARLDASTELQWDGVAAATESVLNAL